jgi:ABC-type bacteriocin/lantibiotic exporter with double-glycine peptidase domain
LIDGQDLRGLDLHSYRRQLGVVLQGGRLGAGSIFENVSMGRNLGVAAVHTALRRAGLESDVSNMPMGIHTVVGEGGSNLSGGQRQRVLIARALAGQPRVLIFDEATSHLDNRTQAVVTESLASLEATRVVVAHRLSTVRDADRIYVIDNGVVVEEGDCQTLLERGGVFASLAERQLV